MAKMGMYWPKFGYICQPAEGPDFYRFSTQDTISVAEAIISSIM
jgi:hypothetical protein